MFIQQPLWSTIFVLIGIGMEYLGVRAMQRSMRTKSWKQTQGTITSSELRQSDSRNSKGRTTVAYSADVRYTYSVNGKEYKANAIRSNNGMASSLATGANDLLQRFPAGASVPVWYDPAVPGDSVLIQGASARDFFIIAVGSFFFVIGILLGAGVLTSTS